jgi:GNAT superfamily N-acetyltransferase
MSLPNEVTGQWVIRAETAVEISALNAQIFRIDELNLFQVPPERETTTQRLQQSHAPSNPECILFYNESNQAVSWFYSYREEAATLFIDTVGFLPDYRGRGLYTAFLRQYIAYAAALGFERLTTNHHPNNRAIMIAELKAGFNVVGLELHEGSGPLVKMAYFMHADRRAGFEGAFSMVPDPTAQ